MGGFQGIEDKVKPEKLPLKNLCMYIYIYTTHPLPQKRKRKTSLLGDINYYSSEEIIILLSWDLRSICVILSSTLYSFMQLKGIEHLFCVRLYYSGFSRESELTGCARWQGHRKDKVPALKGFKSREAIYKMEAS